MCVFASAVFHITHSSPKGKWKKKLLVKDAIADIALQQVLTRPEGEYNALAPAHACVQGSARVGNHVWGFVF
jgi:hypothetical protein